MHRSAPLTRTLLPYRTPTLLGMLQRKSGRTLCLPLCSNSPLPSRRLRRTLCVLKSCRKEQGSHCTRNRTRRIRRSARSGIEKVMTKEERNAVVLRAMTEKEGERDIRAGLTPGLRPAVPRLTSAHLVVPDMTGTTTQVNAISTLARRPTADRVLHLPVEGTRVGPIVRVQDLVPLRLASDPMTTVLAAQMGTHLPIVLCQDPQLPLLLPEKQNAQLVWQPCQRTLKKCSWNGTSVSPSVKKRKGRFTRRRRRKEDRMPRMGLRAVRSSIASTRNLWPAT